MASIKRVLVYLKRGGEVRQAHFTDCLIDVWNTGSLHTKVRAELQDDKLILEQQDDSEGVLLTHPPFCPVHCLTKEEIRQMPQSSLERGIDVGVVALLQSIDRKLLLTRRADHMRTFPRTWVPPGGHIESGETLSEAVKRELMEETGLCTESLSVTPLCMWESVYPYILSMGPPLRHHLVIYFVIRSPRTALEMSTQLNLDPGEVGAAMWIDESQAGVVASGKFDDDCAELDVMVVEKDKVNVEKASAAVLAASAPLTGPDIERVSTGTRYAVQQWLQL